MKKLIIAIISFIIVGCSNPTAMPEWYEGYWICSEVKNTWYAYLTTDSLFIERVIADNGVMQGISFSRGTISQVKPYASAYSSEPINDKIIDVILSGNSDTLYMDVAGDSTHIFLRY